MPSKRLLFWITFLGGAGLLAAWSEFGAAPDPTAVVPVAPRPPGAAVAARAAVAHGAQERTPLPAPAALAASAAPAALAPASAGALFLAQSWAPKPPPPAPAPPPPPPPPPAPAAPPSLPFRFMGRLDDGQVAKVFLHNGERVYTASVGDVLEGQYRLTRVDAGQLTFVYLPLEATLVLPLGRPS